MSVNFKPFTGQPGFTPDYMNVFDFLVRLNQPIVRTEGFLWGRWEWMFSLIYLDTSSLYKIGTWEADGKIVALATYEQTIGDVWFCVDPAYAYLKEEMLEYAKINLSKDGKLSILINDTDKEFQSLAARQGFKPTQDGEKNSLMVLKEANLTYNLPEGYRILSLADELNLKKYNQVLWRGFNHEGDTPQDQESLESRRIELSGPHVDLNLKIAVAAPNGDFAAYCGMWHLPGSDYALVEPVATDPDYRRMGLGKAAVLEGVKRCAERGAKVAYVGSSQQFYYNIGFSPCSTFTWWEYKGN